MGTRTNFYKNPSITYKKDLSLSSVLQNLKAYNIATGNTPPIEERPPAADGKTACRKRQRNPELPSPPRRQTQNREIEENDGPMSHQDYIDKRRKEVSASQAYEELTADVLGKPGTSCLKLVQYDKMNSVSLIQENLFVSYVVNMKNIYAMRPMTASAAWSAKLIYWKLLKL